MVEGTREHVYEQIEEFIKGDLAVIKEEAVRVKREVMGYEKELDQMIASLEKAAHAIEELNKTIKEISTKRVPGLWGTTKSAIPLRHVEL